MKNHHLFEKYVLEGERSSDSGDINESIKNYGHAAEILITQTRNRNMEDNLEKVYHNLRAVCLKKMTKLIYNATPMINNLNRIRDMVKNNKDLKSFYKYFHAKAVKKPIVGTYWLEHWPRKSINNSPKLVMMLVDGIYNYAFDGKENKILNCIKKLDGYCETQPIKIISTEDIL